MDAYNLRARFLPMVLVLLPLGLAASSWLPGGFTLESVAGGSTLTLTLSALLIQLARDQGKRKESQLYTQWGGKPSDLTLSYLTSTLSGLVLKKTHEKLRSENPLLEFPADKATELAAPEKYRAVFEAASEYLRSRYLKDKLVHEENINYGYRRNLWGMKFMGLSCVLIGLLGIGSHAGFSFNESRSIASDDLFYAGVCILLLLAWVARINPGWVKTAAFSYAEQLVRAIERSEH